VPRNLRKAGPDSGVFAPRRLALPLAAALFQGHERSAFLSVIPGRCGSLKEMRRLLQLSTLVLLVTLVAAPISEAMDRWDPPGLGHDTEFALVAFVVCLALVLLVSRLLALRGMALTLVAALFRACSSQVCLYVPLAGFRLSPSASSSPPLRI
jgi:hypothetical protein